MAPASFLARGCSSALMSSSEQPAGCDHRNGHGIGKRDGGVDIQALQHAVARDVGVDDGGNAGVFEAPGDIEHGEFRAFR